MGARSVPHRCPRVCPEPLADLLHISRGGATGARLQAAHISELGAGGQGRACCQGCASSAEPDLNGKSLAIKSDGALLYSSCGQRLLDLRSRFLGAHHSCLVAEPAQNPCSRLLSPSARGCGDS